MGPNSAELDAWLRDYVARASRPDYADYFVRRMDDGILARVPAVRDDPFLVDDLHESTRSHWIGFLGTLIQPEAELVFPEPAAEFARSVARRGHELGVLLKVYRAGNLILWEHFTEVIDDLPATGPTRDETLVFLWSHGGAWLDESIERITEIYYEVQAQALETRIAGKRDTVRALLEGHPPAEDASGAFGARAEPVADRVRGVGAAGDGRCVAPDAGRCTRFRDRPGRTAPSHDPAEQPRSVVLGGDPERPSSRGGARVVGPRRHRRGAGRRRDPRARGGRVPHQQSGGA